MDTLLQVMEREPKRLRGQNPRVDADLETICLKCLEKEPEKRYGSAEALADDLERWLKGDPINARPAGTVERAWRWCRRNPLVAGLTAAVAASLVIGLIVSSYFAVEAHRQAVQAQDERDRAQDNAHRADQNAAKAEANAKQALKEKQRADEDGEVIMDFLAASHYAEAKALLQTNQPGRRSQALKLLHKAEGLRNRHRQTSLPELEQLPSNAELRTAALAALLLPDDRLLREMELTQINLPAVLRADGLVAAGAWADFDMSRLSKLDVSTSKSGVRIVEVLTGRELGRWPYQGAIFFNTAPKALSPDGKLLASGVPHNLGKDMQIHFWELPQGKRHGRILEWPKDKDSQPGWLPDFPRLLFSPDGKYLAGLKRGNPPEDVGETVLWDLKKGQGRILARYKNQDKKIGIIAFSSDSKLLAYQTGERKIALWNLVTQEPAGEIELPLTIDGHSAFGANAHLLAIPCKSDKVGEQTIVVWDISNKVERARYPIKASSIGTALAFHPSGKQLAVAEGTDIVLIDLQKNTEAYRLYGPAKGAVVEAISQIALLAWQPDGRHLVSVGLDGWLKLWAVGPSTARTLAMIDPQRFSLFAFSPDGQWLALGFQSSVRLINRSNGKVVRSFTLTTNVQQLLFNSNSQQLAAVCGAKGMSQAVVWEVPDGKEIANRQHEREGWQFAVFNPEGQLLVSGSEDLDGGKGTRLTVRNASTDQRIWQTNQPTRFVAGYLSADGRRLFVAPGFSSRGPITVWEIATGRKLSELPFPDGAVTGLGLGSARSPDGNWLALDYVYLPSHAGKSGAIEGAKTGDTGMIVWNLPSGEKRLTIQNAVTAAFSPDSRLLATSQRDGHIYFYDLASAEEIFRWKANVEWPSGLTFTPDGKSLIATYAKSPQQTLHLDILRKEFAEISESIPGLDWIKP